MQAAVQKYTFLNLVDIEASDFVWIQRKRFLLLEDLYGMPKVQIWKTDSKWSFLVCIQAVVQNFILLDPDVVAHSNLVLTCRTVFF